MAIWRRLVRRHRQSPNLNCADNKSGRDLGVPRAVLMVRRNGIGRNSMNNFPLAVRQVYKEAPREKTRDDIDKAQREEQAGHERALEKKQNPRRSDERTKDSRQPQERKDDARD